MKAVKTIALGAVGLAALAGASAPAAAQYYGSPYGGYPYGGYNNYQYGYPMDIIGQVIQSMINPYGQFGWGGYGTASPQLAVNQCTAAVQQRLSRSGYSGYGGYGAYGGYAQPYGYNGYGNARIVGISRVEQTSPSTLRVRGYASSGMTYGQPYGGYGNYGSPYGGYGSYGSYGRPDLSFRCDVDYRGYIRDIDIRRR